MPNIFDRGRSLGEWFLVLLLTAGGMTLFFADPITSGGPIVRILGSQAAGIVYALVFISSGLALAYGKARRKRRVHKHALLAIYLLSIFTFSLELAVLGWTWYLVDSIIVFLISGSAWLYWKMHTEYINPDLFVGEVKQAMMDKSCPPIEKENGLIK